jgi:hypothetical protein
LKVSVGAADVPPEVTLVAVPLYPKGLERDAAGAGQLELTVAALLPPVLSTPELGTSPLRPVGLEAPPTATPFALV